MDRSTSAGGARHEILANRKPQARSRGAPIAGPNCECTTQRISVKQARCSHMRKMQMTTIRMMTAAIAACLGFATGAVAQDEKPGGAVQIELNAVKSNEGSCTLTFLVTNGHAGPIEKVVYETVLFDSAGQVDRLTLFDFGTLPSGRPRVRQFSIPGITCDDLSRVLINGASTCQAPDLAESACEAGLILETRTGIEVIG
ncbi:MAG: hypothetical protein ACNA7F_06300 [Roseovarius sp.]